MGRLADERYVDDFAPVSSPRQLFATAQYYRIRSSSCFRDENPYFCMDEFELYNENGNKVTYNGATFMGSSTAGGGYAFSAAFDGTSQDFCSNWNAGCIGWIGVQLAAPVQVSAYAIKADVPNDTPNNFTFESSTDSITWTAIDSHTDVQWSYLERKFFNLPEGTSSPSTYPTQAPSLAPTSQPTSSAPTPSPWNITFSGMTTNFSTDSSDEIILTYEIGRDRAFESQLYSKSCETRKNINVTYDTSNLTIPSDPSMATLTLKYDLNKTTLANSNMWNSEYNKIELCHILQLVVHTTDSGEMVISEDKRKIDITFDMTADFNLTNVLDAATIEASSENVDVQDYVSAFRCDGPDFNKAAGALRPNDEMFICIKSASSEVEIKDLVSMVSIPF